VIFRLCTVPNVTGVPDVIDPSASPPPLFWLARTKSSWRAGAPTKIWLAAAGDFFRGGGGGIRRDLVNGGTSHY